jgi:hypothetical protein
VDPTRVSDRLFGRGCRLPLAAWIATNEKGVFYQGEPPRFGTTSQSNIRQELQRLVEIGMLDVEQRDDSRRVYYVRTDSSLWRIVDVAVEVTGIRWDGSKLTES